MFTFFKNYDLKDLPQDLIAGITLGAVLIPIAMAFGELAGVGAVAGLKASIFPLLAYTIFTSSRLIIVGPEASTAALVGATILPLAAGDPNKALLMASTLALIVGIFLSIAGIFRLGFIANFIPKQVLVGFMTALGILIILEQLEKILGLQLSAGNPFSIIKELSFRLSELHLPTLATALFSMSLIYLFSTYLAWLPGQLVVMGLSILAVSFFHIDQYGIEVVGELPKAIPIFSIPTISWSEFLLLIPSGLSIAIIAFTDSILTAKTFADKNKVFFDPNQESIAIGLGNVVSGLSQGLSISVSASRTSLSEAIGSKTRLVGILAPLTLLLFVTSGGLSIIKYLPQAVLGSILIMSGWRLIEINEFKRFYVFRKQGFFIALATLLAVLSLGVLQGIFIAIVLSFTLVVYHFAQVPFTVIVKKSNLLVVNVGPAIFFANADAIRSNINKLINTQRPKIKYIFIDATPFVSMDLSAADMLQELQNELHSKEIILGFVGAQKHIKDLLKLTNMDQKLLLINKLEDINPIHS